MAAVCLSEAHRPRERGCGSLRFWVRREQSGDAGDAGPWLHQLCRGSELALPAPPERVRSAALQERLAKLKKDLEAKTYAAMVHDVTGEARSASCASRGQDSRTGEWCCAIARRQSLFFSACNGGSASALP